MDFIEQILGHKLADGKQVKYSKNRELWYKIQSSDSTLFLPPVEVLRSNVLEIDKAVEAAVSFDTLDVETLCGYEWSDDYLDSVVSESLVYILASMDSELYVSCDIETCDVGYNNNRVLLIGFCTQLGGREMVATISPEGENRALVQRVFDNKNLKFIWHNGKFDTTRLFWLAGIRARVDEDTMLMHYIGINEKKGTHGLKQLGQLYLQAPAWDDELDEYKRSWCKQRGVKLAEFTYDMVPLQTLVPYLRRDVLATYRLKVLLDKLVRPNSRWIYRKLVEASNVYREIELNGVKLNKPHLERLKLELSSQSENSMAVAEKIISEHWDPVSYCKETGAALTKSVYEFSMKSPKKLKWIIERVVGFPVESTSRETLEELSEHMEKIKNEEGRRFISAITEARRASKYYDTYAVGLESVCCSDGRVRCTYNLHGTETGRLSSTSPNMQNIPRNSNIKDLITCEPGNILVQLDYSQAELRTLAALSGDEYLLHIYTTGQDLHDMMATKMFGPGFTKEQRVITKSLNFGIAYGRGPQSIAQMFKLSMSEAKKTVADWYAAVPKVERFIAEKRREPFTGKNCVTPFGRERHFVITSENRYHVSNEAINFPIQSIASDLTMLSVLDLQKWIDESSLSSRVKIVATVHDSIVFEVEDSPELVKEVVTTGKKIMESKPAEFEIGVVDVPFRADAEVGYTWGRVEEYATV